MGKRTLLIIRLIIGCALSAHGTTLEQAYRKGEALGRMPLPSPNPHALKKMAGAKVTPHEVAYIDHPESLSSRATKLLRKGAGKMLRDIEGARPVILIDPKTDPLLTASDRIINAPRGTSHQPSPLSPPSHTTHLCYEAGDSTQHTCSMRRLVTLKDIPPETKRINVRRYRDNFSGPLILNILTGKRLDADARYRGLEHAAGIRYQGEGFPASLIPHVKASRVISGAFRITPDHNVHCTDTRHVYRSTNIGTIEVVYAPPPTEKDLTETIDDTCSPLEKLCDDGRCHYGAEGVIEGPEARLIQKGGNALRVDRPWWHKKRTYYCETPSATTCDRWRQCGCTQIHSRCHKKKGARCVEWEQTFQCPSAPSSPTASSTIDGLPFGADGREANTTWKPNSDMTEVLAKLSLLKHIHQDERVAKTGKIFRGQSCACSKHCLQFSDCCALSSGWGENLHLTQCSSTEKLLGQKRQEGKCHLVGTYCAEKAPLTKMCLRKKTTFCCFDSKLARVIHEQGRAQQGIQWGTPEAPQCRALTLDEFARINFDRVDLRAIYKDILDHIKLPVTSKLVQEFQHNWKARLPSSSDV